MPASLAKEVCHSGFIGNCRERRFSGWDYGNKAECYLGRVGDAGAERLSQKL